MTTRLNRKTNDHRSAVVALLTGLICAMVTLPDAMAQGFAARVGPPNFEFVAKPGERVRDIITIQNDADQIAEYVVRTADWDLDAGGGVSILPEDEVLPERSCRPWVRLERPRFKLASKALKRYRFEATVPEGARGECRFAILLAPAPETLPETRIGNLNVPIAGQIAIIVYITVGDAKPNLTYQGAGLVRRGDRAVPVIKLANTGSAHGRPFGNLATVDATGRRYDLVAVPFPILPDRTQEIFLQPDTAFGVDAENYEPQLPLHIKGLIEWEGGSVLIDDTLMPMVAPTR